MRKDKSTDNQANSNWCEVLQEFPEYIASVRRSDDPFKAYEALGLLTCFINVAEIPGCGFSQICEFLNTDTEAMNEIIYGEMGLSGEEYFNVLKKSKTLL